ncbi:MAG TPA: cysteine rich repeat-containing protein [Burkholderiaceae bacterium]
MNRTLLLISTLLSAGSVWAENPPAKLDRLSDCRTDLQKLCPNVQPGGGRLMACLKDNKENVSDACKQRMQQIRQSRKDGKRPDNPNGG